MTPQPSLQLLYNESRLSTLLDALDELHSAASDGNIRAVTSLTNAELIGMLRDIIYTAQETMEEIEANNSQREVGLSLVRKTS